MHHHAERPKHTVGRDPAIVFRDAYLCVVYKPSGFLSVPAPGRRDPSVVRAVERWLGRGLAVHRIDEGTSGLLLVALDEQTQFALKALFEVHTIERRYLAWVSGNIRKGEKKTIRSALVRNRGDGLRGSGGHDGKPAVTHLECITGMRDVSLVQATLETGRTHQVRIHLAESGHPILGDELYGGRHFSRLALHATQLGFVHPHTNQPLSFNSPLPDELARLARPAEKSFPRGRSRG